MEKTPDAQLPSLMDALVQNKHRFDQGRNDSSAWQSLAGETLARVLEKYGEQVSVETLYAWLDKGTDEYGFTVLHHDSRDHHAKVRDWLNARPDIIKKLFLYWLQTTTSNQLEKKANYFFGCMQFIWPSTPSWFPEWCLELAGNNPDEDVSTALFRIGISHLLYQPIKPPYPLDRAFSFIEHFPRFEPLLEPFLSYQLQDHDWDRIHKRNQSTATKDIQKRKNIDNLIERLDGIRNGTDLGAIYYLGQVYYGLFLGMDRKTASRERMREETTFEIAQAAEEGFMQCLMNPNLPTPEEISRLYVERKYHHIIWAILAAMDTVFENNPTEIWNLPKSTLASAMALRLSSHSNEAHPEWFMEIVVGCPDLVSETLIPFWLVQLQSNEQHISGLYALARDNTWSEVAQRAAFPLLESCPINLEGDTIQHLLVATWKWGDRQALHELVLTILGCREGPTPEWPLWAGSAFLLDYTVWPQLQLILCYDKGKAVAFLRFVGTMLHGDEFSKSTQILNLSLPVPAIQILFENFGPLWPPISRFDNDGHVTTDGEMSDRLQAMINRLATETSTEATIALQTLANNDDLASWRERLRHSLAMQRQLVADKAFPPLAWDAVFGVVNSGAPTTAGDLQALVMDQIRSIARVLRDGNTDGYKFFWNLDSYGRTNGPIPEEDGRDRLLERLRDQLSPLGINANPEDHYADDKRADIKVSFQNWNLPIEIKRDDHDQLWKAPDNQLIAQYVRDPGTDDYGIYLVFWYGEHGNGLKGPPRGSGISSPITCQELEDALQKRIPSDYRHSVIVMVLDVSTRKPAKSP